MCDTANKLADNKSLQRPVPGCLPIRGHTTTQFNKLVYGFKKVFITATRWDHPCLSSVQRRGSFPAGEPTGVWN